MDAVKASFVEADEAGWLHHDLESYIEWFAADAELTAGRSDTPGPYDITSNRETLKAVRSMEFQAPLPPGFRFDYPRLDVNLSDDKATLAISTLVRFDGGYQTWDGKVELRRTSQGWKAVESRWWLVNQKTGDELTTFDAVTLARLDDEVEKQRVAGDRHALADALFNARRVADAHKITKDLTSMPNAPVSDWILRGRLALPAYDPADAVVAFKNAVSLDPRAPIPYYKELIVAAPPKLELTGVDLPADREQSLRSRNSETPAEIAVHNTTPYTLDIYWLDFEGRRHHDELGEGRHVVRLDMREAEPLEAI